MLVLLLSWFWFQDLEEGWIGVGVGLLMLLLDCWTTWHLGFRWVRFGVGGWGYVSWALRALWICVYYLEWA